MSSAEYRIVFNQKPPTDPQEFRNLPWGQYFTPHLLSDLDQDGQYIEKTMNDQYNSAREFYSIIHSGNPTYWPKEFSVKMRNAKDDYIMFTEVYGNPADRTYTDLDNNVKTAKVQFEDENQSRDIVAKAGTVIWNKTLTEEDSLRISSISNPSQDPANYLADIPGYQDLFWTDAAHTDKIRLTWAFYLIDANRTKMQ